MTTKTLRELRADWRRQARRAFCEHLPVMLVAAVVSPAMLRATVPEIDMTLAARVPGLISVLDAPYWMLALGCLPFLAVFQIPLVISCLQPYPSKASFELNAEIRRARAAAGHVAPERT